MNILISCIGRRGYIAKYFREAAGSDSNIVGTSNSPWTPGFKNCDKTFLLPDIVSDNYIDELRSLCKAEKIDLLLSTLDLDIHRLSEHRQKFVDDGIATFIVPHRVSQICFDKMETVRFLEANEFAQPRTFDSADLAIQAIDADEVAYPVFVKPRFGFGSNNLFQARSHDELRVFFSYAKDMIIQEKLKGEEYSFDILNDLNGNFVKVVVKQKMLMRSGETDQALTIKSDQLTEFAKRLGAVVQHIGPMDVDLFWDGGEPSILEMNPRFGGGYPISQMAGADYPLLMVKMAAGEDVTMTAPDYQEGIRMMKEISAFECSSLVVDAIDMRNQKNADG